MKIFFIEQIRYRLNVSDGTHIYFSPWNIFKIQHGLLEYEEPLHMSLIKSDDCTWKNPLYPRRAQ